jgi:manganese/iron transport system substrate-binding protein
VRRMTAWVLLLLSLGILSVYFRPTAATSGDKADTATEKTPAAIASPLRLVATTTIVADLAAQVAGNRAVVHALVRPGQDPHTYQPLPADIKAVIEADVVLLHGAGLDAWANRLIQQADGKAALVTVTQGIAPLPAVKGPDDHEPAAGHIDAHTHSAVDPHYWFDPLLVKSYVENICTALTAADPRNADYYQDNCARYLQELDRLDAWIRNTVRAVPPERRKLVTNHNTFAYFAARYGFQVVGTVIPGFATSAETSAQQVRALVNDMRRENVNVVFTETTVNPQLAHTIAAELGLKARVVPLYTGSLSELGGPADTYLKMMRYNVQAIVEGLRP